MSLEKFAKIGLMAGAKTGYKKKLYESFEKETDPIELIDLIDFIEEYIYFHKDKISEDHMKFLSNFLEYFDKPENYV